MNWFFWKKDKQDQSMIIMEQLSNQLLETKDQIRQLSDTTIVNSHQLEGLGDQLTKQTRIQYKSGQEIQSKLENITQNLVQAQQWQTECTTMEKELNGLHNHQELLLQVLLNQLDELDTAYTGFNGDVHTEWQPLFKQWIVRIISALAEIGIYEIDMIGQSFNPQMAEGLGVIPRPSDTEATIPYEIVQILKRGFIDHEGRLLRKAQVITYQEEIK